MVGDVQMSHRAKPHGLPEQLPIMLQELARISRAGIGDDKADVEITRGVCKHREEVRFGKVERDDTVLDTRRPGAFSADRPQQRLSPGDESDMNSCRRYLARELLADTGRRTSDDGPWTEPSLINLHSHIGLQGAP